MRQGIYAPVTAAEVRCQASFKRLDKLNGARIRIYSEVVNRECFTFHQLIGHIVNIGRNKIPINVGMKTNAYGSLHEMSIIKGNQIAFGAPLNLLSSPRIFPIKSTIGKITFFTNAGMPSMSNSVLYFQSK